MINSIMCLFLREVWTNIRSPQIGLNNRQKWTVPQGHAWGTGESIRFPYRSVGGPQMVVPMQTLTPVWVMTY